MKDEWKTGPVVSSIHPSSFILHPYESAAGVLLLVVFEIFTAADVGDPLLVVEVPLHGLLEPFLEADRRPPAEFLLHFRAVDGVAAVVAGPVLDVADQRPRLAHRVEQRVRQFEVVALAVAADVVDLADAPLAPHAVDAGAVVADVDPVADVEAVAVD